MSCAGRGILLRQIDRLFGDGSLASLGDRQLLERFLDSGDETAFEALVDRHGPMVLGLCRRMLRDPRDIEDAFQATFLVLVRTGRSIRDRSLVSTWLYRVAFRVARDARAQTLRHKNCEVQVVDLDIVSKPATNEMLECGTVLDQELRRLPEKYRAPLVLCYLEGRTHDEAAAALRCPVGTVRSRLSRGRDLLRKRLTRGGYAPTTALLAMNPTATFRLMSERVPPSLVSHTVKLALRSGASKSIEGGVAAASVLALTQGVVTTMKLSRIKWIGCSLLAASLPAGGAVAVSYARAMGTVVRPPASHATAGVIGFVSAPELQNRVASPRALKGWGEPIDPDGDCLFDLAHGRLTITVPAPAPPRQGHGLEAEGKTLNAPRVLREIEGDFIADLKVGGTFKPAGPSANPRVFPFVGAGLLLWNDAGNYFRLERAAIDRNGRLIPYALFQERRDSQLLPPFDGMQLPDGPVVLRLERKGDQISGSFSPDGTNWRSFPPHSVKFPAKLKLGVAAISSSRQPFVVTLEQFRVLRPE
jgi:RNA polymerase sigma factor (sigma-70 family)